MTRVLALGCLAFVLWTGGASAASFDCKDAHEPDEQAVCGSMALSDLDVKMATLFDVAGHLVAMGQRGALRDEQANFLNARAMCKANVACLTNIYNVRIKDLEGVLRAIYARGPF